jgi:hypothetical protein
MRSVEADTWEPNRLIGAINGSRCFRTRSIDRCDQQKSKLRNQIDRLTRSTESDTSEFTNRSINAISRIQCFGTESIDLHDQQNPVLRNRIDRLTRLAESSASEQNRSIDAISRIRHFRTESIDHRADQSTERRSTPMPMPMPIVLATKLDRIRYLDRASERGANLESFRFRNWNL